MADVFISYSRKDKDFVRKLNDALAESDRNTWVDWQDIPVSAEWWEEIKSGIESADTFICVISPDLVSSPICYKEVDYAAQNNKRIFPILYREGFAPEKLHDALNRHNWLFFRDSDNFQQAFQTLLQALDTDLEYVRFHTRLLMRAIEWEKRQRNQSFLLRGDDLKDAEQWFAQCGTKKPRPSTLQIEYITTSRKSEDAEQQAEEMLRQAAVRAKQIRNGAIGAAIALVGLSVGGAAIISHNKIARATRISELELQGARVQEQFATMTPLARTGELDLLLDAMRMTQSLIQMQEGDRPSFINEYPADSPILALQQILYGIHERDRFEGHTAGVKGVSISPDGKYLATASEDYTARIWTLSGKVVAELRGHQGKVVGIAFSPDGHYVATAAEDGTSRLWTLDGKSIQTFSITDGGDRPIKMLSIAFSPDGNYLTTGAADGTIRVWDRTTRQQIRAFQTSSAWIWSVNVSPDGQHIVAGSADGTVTIWEPFGYNTATNSANPLAQYRNSSEAVWSVQFSPDGQTVLTGAADGVARLLRFRDNSLQFIQAYTGHRGAIRSVQFSPDGRSIATGSADGTARIWSATGSLIQELVGHQGWIWSVAFSPDGQSLVTGSADRTARLWKIAQDWVTDIEGHQGIVFSVQFCGREPYLATASADGTARLWKPSGQLVRTFKSDYQGEVLSVSCSQTGQRLATASADGYARLWTLDANQPPLEFNMGQPHGMVTGVSLSPDGQYLAAASEDGTLWLWNTLNTQDPIWQSQPGMTGNSVNFSPDGQRIATGSSDGVVRFWNLISAQPVQEWSQSKGAIATLSFSPNGQAIATASDDGTIRLWNPSGTIIREIQSHQGEITGIHFSPRSDFLATSSSDGTARLWNMSGDLIQELRGHRGAVLGISISPDGQQIATASADRTVRLWRILGNLDQTVTLGCEWLQPYLNNPSVQLEESDRQMCPE
ncbi:MAG TPA: TIR domain-containing protein [Crinalium sp.]